MDLAGPAGEVAQRIDRALDIHGACLGDRFAHVDGLDLCQLVAISVDQVSQPMDQAFAFQWLELAPGAAVELRTRGTYRAVEVFGGSHRDTRQHAFGGRLDDFGAGAVTGLKPGTSDEHALRLGQESLGRLGNAEGLQVGFYLVVHGDSPDQRALARAWKMKPMLFISSCAARIEVTPAGS
ncbi:hypothetical protein D3C72_1589250 [compost metagenome]